MKVRLAALAIACVMVVLATPGRAADKVSFGQVSPTATGWPGIVADKKGFFAAENVAMDVVSIGVSPGVQAVAAGSLDIVHNPCNAMVAFHEGGGTKVRLGMVTMSIHPAVLIGKKGLKDIAELKGRVVGTSSIKSGSTILLRRLLKAHGLGDGDYDLVAGQGTVQIFNGLQAGAMDAVWLVPPQSYVASGAGYSVLGSFREVAPNYPFVCFGVSTDWLASKPDVARRFARAWFKGVAWLTDPNNRAEAEALLAQELKVSADAAAKTYDSLIVQNTNTFSRDGRIDPEALRNIVTVMVEGEELPAMPQGDLRKYLDETMLGQ